MWGIATFVGKSYQHMGFSDKSSIWFTVVNVYAASRSASSKWNKAEQVLKASGLEYHGNRTGRSGNAMEITFDACMAGYRRFVAVGGDGTVHDVLNGIASYIDWTPNARFSDFTLAVIPLGSGNDWIKSIGIPKDVDTLVKMLESPVLAKQDVVRVSIIDDMRNPISVSYMANVGGVGLDARVCESVNAQKSRGKRGKILYIKSLIQAIRHRSPAKAKVYVDGELVFDGSYFSMAFGIGKYSGGGMRQTPDAVLNDGLLDMTIIPELPMRRIAKEVWRLFTGTFLKVPELIAAKSSRITVFPYDNSSAEPVEVDGEVIGKAPVCLEVLEDQINILAAE